MRPCLAAERIEAYRGTVHVYLLYTFAFRTDRHAVQHLHAPVDGLACKARYYLSTKPHTGLNKAGEIYDHWPYRSIESLGAFTASLGLWANPRAEIRASIVWRPPLEPLESLEPTAQGSPCSYLTHWGTFRCLCSVSSAASAPAHHSGSLRPLHICPAYPAGRDSARGSCPSITMCCAAIPSSRSRSRMAWHALGLPCYSMGPPGFQRCCTHCTLYVSLPEAPGWLCSYTVSTCPMYGRSLAPQCAQCASS